MKKIILPLIIIATAIYSCGNKDKKATPVAEKPEVKIDSALITDSSWGLITKKTDFAGLQAIYGAANVKDERICGPECADSIDVTIIYPEKNNEFTVYWKDNLYHTAIAFIETYLPDGPYHTANGLKIGSSLEDLLKINGKQIIFSGFDWDYGGSIQDYGMGTLQNSPLGFRLEMTGDGGTELSGDSEFNTEMPEVKKNLTKIKILALTLSFSKG
ncbi:MAG: hypothetical protein LH619_02305 [Chitinophagaceae bacterium]|nr:hypothetical protein [Chitinophagaceae bacterium]